MTVKAWLITGVSKGLCLTLAERLLAAAFKVVATTRDKAILEKEVGPASDQLLPPAKAAVDKTLNHFGSLEPQVKHWDGATATTGMRHISVTFPRRRNTKGLDQ